MHIPVWAFSFVCICVSTALPKDKMQLAAMRKLCNKDIQNKHSTHCKDNLEQWEVFTTESCKINIEYVEKNTFEQRMWSVLPYFRRLLEAQFFLYYEEQVADIFVDIWIFSEALSQQKAPTVPSIWTALIKFIWAGERHLCTISFLVGSVRALLFVVCFIEGWDFAFCFTSSDQENTICAKLPSPV